MRRLLFLALFVALVAGVGFSQPVITGMFQYGVYSDFQVTPEQALYGKLIITEPLDKFSTIVFRFRWKDLNFINGESIVTAPSVPAIPIVVSPDWDIDRFYISTDVTGALGVTGNVTMKLGFGFQDPNGADLTGGISPFEVADLSGNDVGGGSQATIFPVFTFNKMINIGAIIAPGQFNADPLTVAYNKQGYEIFANGGQGPVMVEAGFGNIYSAPGGGAVSNGEVLRFIWGAANYKAAQGDLAYALAVNGQYNLNSDGAGFMLRNHYAAGADDGSDVNWGVGVAASVTYQKNYTAKVGVVGIDGAPVNRAEAQLIVVADPKVTFDAGAVFNLNSDYTSGSGADMLNDFTVAATINLGLANFRIGYLYIDKAAPYSVMSDDIGRIGDTNGPAFPSSGAFIESIINF